MKNDVLGRDCSDHVTVVGRQRREPRVRSFDEDLRHEPCGAEHALNAKNFMSDRVAIAERGEHLMNGVAAHAGTAPFGILSRISWAGGTSRLRRANQPRSGSRCLWAERSGALCNCRNMSRYLRSITGHA